MARKLQPISNAIQAKLEGARVARLATLDAEYGPHIVPVCFVYDGKVFYSAVDRKPKRVAPERLARLRHIMASPQIALIIDEYREDWETALVHPGAWEGEADSEISTSGTCPGHPPAPSEISAVCGSNASR